MHAWLRPILDRLGAGLIPLDGDFGRRGAASEANDICHALQPAHRAPGPEAETAWIPRAILYGPPL